MLKILILLKTFFPKDAFLYKMNELNLINLIEFIIIIIFKFVNKNKHFKGATMHN